MSKRMARLVAVSIVAALAGVAGGCSPEVGTKAWCEWMEEKPKGDWTANEATDFAKHCIFD